MIRAEAGIDGDPGDTPNGIVLIVFVHGWKHNADPSDNNVEALRAVLTQLSLAEKAQNDHPARKVVGVYVGWRGLSQTIEPFKELSFWGRKETAHKVGGYGALTELLVVMERIQKESLRKLPDDSARTELVIIGHSFGAAALYSALGQIITERFVNTVAQPRPRRLKPLGDQVILLNPAFEAARYFDLDQLARTYTKYSADQRPVLSIFTSDTDWATHFVFPIGRFFSTIFESNRDSAQKQAVRQTIGWFKPFITHRLDYDPEAQFPTTRNSVATKQSLPEDAAFLRQSHEKIKDRRQEWVSESGPSLEYPFDKSVLKPVASFPARDPFLIVSVDRRIMDGHNDITNPVLLNFIREYIQFCQWNPKDHSE
jgi:hypothetical protein